MIKTILAPATGNSGDAATFATALAIARPFAAHIDALHVRLGPVEAAVAMMAGDGSGGGGVLLENVVEQLGHDAAEREAKTHAVFANFCRGEGIPLAAAPGAGADAVSGQWHSEIGQEARWTVAYGTTSDLIVASRRTSDGSGLARSTIEALLLETGRPLLITDGSIAAALAERVAIAWKPTPQAARAVAFAMPILSHAKAVSVLTVVEDEGGEDDAERLVRYLQWHGVKAVAERLTAGPDAAETLLAAASPRSELLVMGGYGHTRLREWVFGGFTQRVLADAPLPILIAH
jgi:nucleotide-binding universal stress UspA family protein